VFWGGGGGGLFGVGGGGFGAVGGWGGGVGVVGSSPDPSHNLPTFLILSLEKDGKKKIEVVWLDFGTRKLVDGGVFGGGRSGQGQNLLGS